MYPRNREFRRYQRERLISKRVKRARRLWSNWGLNRRDPGDIAGWNEAHDRFLGCPNGKSCRCKSDKFFKVPSIQRLRQHNRLDLDILENLK